MTRTQRTKYVHFALAVGLLLYVSPVDAQETTATKELKTWSTEFDRDIIEVAPGVYTAVGYGASKLTMLVGDEEVIIVDTGTVLQTGDLTLEQMKLVQKVQEVSNRLNDLIPEQSKRHAELRSAYNAWASAMRRRRHTLDLRGSKPPDLERLRRGIEKARAEWWEATRDVHRAEERLNCALERLFR